MHKGLKVVATVTLVCFLTTQCVSGAPAAGIEITGGREFPSYLSIDVPAELGTVDALYEAPASAHPQFVLHIQNAHANYQAQMKIKKLLQHMNKKYGFSTIFVEGASEKLDADYLRFFPDQERNIKLCDELAKQGELTGAELFLMEQTSSTEYGVRSTAQTVGTPSAVSDTPYAFRRTQGAEGAVEALGIEDASLYKANYDALKKVFGAGTDVIRFFKGFDIKLDRAASKTFTPEIRELIADWKRFEQGRREFMPFVRSLTTKSKKILKVDLESLFAQVGWPQISRLLVIQQMEKELNKAKGLEEKASLIQDLRKKGISKELLATLENFNEGSIAVGKSTHEVSPREVLERLASEAGPKGFKFSGYPAFSLFAGYVTLRSELDPKALFEEIEYLFTQMLDTMAQEPLQKVLLSLYRDGELLRKLLRLELNRTQWRELLDRKADVAIPSLVARLQAAVQGVRSTEYGENAATGSAVRRTQGAVPGEAAVMPPAFAKTMDGLFTAGLEFYDFAHQREAVFYKEMQTQMKEKGITKAILITGGFHTDGMSDLFRENAVSYGIVTPRLSEKSDENLYQKIMLRKGTGSFETSYLEAILSMVSGKVIFDFGGNGDVTSIINEFKRQSGLSDFEQVKAALVVAAQVAFSDGKESLLMDSAGTQQYDIEESEGGNQYRLVPRAEQVAQLQVGPVKIEAGKITPKAPATFKVSAAAEHVLAPEELSRVVKETRTRLEGVPSRINLRRNVTNNTVEIRGSSNGPQFVLDANFVVALADSQGDLYVRHLLNGAIAQIVKIPWALDLTVLKPGTNTFPEEWVVEDENSIPEAIRQIVSPRSETRAEEKLKPWQVKPAGEIPKEILNAFQRSVKDLQPTDEKPLAVLVEAVLGKQFQRTFMPLRSVKRAFESRDLARIRSAFLSFSSKMWSAVFTTVRSSGDVQFWNEDGTFRSEVRFSVEARQELQDKVISLLSGEVLTWYQDTKPSFGTALMEEVVWGIVVRSEGITAADAIAVAEIMKIYHAQSVAGTFALGIFLKNAKKILDQYPAFAVSQEPGTMIEHLTEMPSDDKLATLGLQLLMNPNQEVIWVYQKGVLSEKNMQNKLLDVQKKISGVVRGGERLKAFSASDVANEIQTRASQSVGVRVATILVEDLAMRDLLRGKTGLIGNILFAEKNKVLGGLQGLAAVRLSQQSAEQITSRNWGSISAALIKEFGQGAFKLDPKGYLVLDNKVLAALERVLSDLVAIQATSVAA